MSKTIDDWFFLLISINDYKGSYRLSMLGGDINCYDQLIPPPPPPPLPPLTPLLCELLISIFILMWIMMMMIH